MANTPASINLFKDKESPLVDKFTQWVLTVGRLIIILTEIIAISAFIYRFSLDERLSNLNSEIKQKQSHLSLLKNDENKYRNLQSRLSLASNFSNESSRVYNTFQEIIGLTPSEIKFINLNLTQNQINMTISILSTSSLKEFVNSLKSYEKIKSVNIENIENRPNSGIYVIISAQLK